MEFLIQHKILGVGWRWLAVLYIFILGADGEEDGAQEKGEITSRAVYLALCRQCVCFSSAILPGLIRFTAPKINTHSRAVAARLLSVKLIALEISAGVAISPSHRANSGLKINFPLRYS